MKYEATLTWGWDSDRRVDPPGWLRANGDGGVPHPGLGQIRQNSVVKGGGGGLMVQTSLVDRNVSNGGCRPAAAFSLLVSAVYVRRRRGGTVVGIGLRHRPAGPRGGGGGPGRGPGGNHGRGPRVRQGGHARQRSAKTRFERFRATSQHILNNLDAVEVFSGGKIN